MDDKYKYLDGIKGVIFDLDGTLIDSMEIWDDIAEGILLDLGRVAKEDLKNETRSMSLNESSEYIVREYKLDISPNDFMAKFKSRIYELYSKEILIKEGALDYLKLLKEKKIKLGILTASERDLAEAILKRYKIYDDFEFIMTTSEEEISKNEIEIYNRALNKLKLKKEEVLVFEDALHCIETAKSGRFKLVGVYEKYFVDDQVKIKELSDIYLESYLDFL